MLRVSEFATLQVEDISLTERILTVRYGKGGKRREVPLSRSLAREIRLHVGGRNAGPLFQSPRGGSYSVRRIQQVVKETAEDAGITKLVLSHVLRHAMATRLVNRGMSLGHIRTVLEHESMGAMRMYVEIETESVKERFDSVIGRGE
jgi:integrase/recombinase XerD